jgi:hypothetical protein
MARRLAMTPPGNVHSHPVTADDVRCWLAAAQQKCVELDALASASGNTPQLYTAFMEMTALLQEAFEEMRVISASLREGSMVVREEAAALRRYSAQLIAQCTTAMEHMAQGLPPSADGCHAESRMLALFKGDRHPHMP